MEEDNFHQQSSTGDNRKHTKQTDFTTGLTDRTFTAVGKI